MVLAYIQDHFMLVTWQKYLYKVVSKTKFLNQNYFFLAYHNIFKLHWKGQFSKKKDMLDVVHLSKNSISVTMFDKYSQVTFIKWSQNFTKNHQKMFFLLYQIFRSISHLNPYFRFQNILTLFKIYPKSDVFGTAWVLVIILEHVEHWGLTRTKKRITLMSHKFH